MELEGRERGRERERERANENRTKREREISNVADLSGSVRFGSVSVLGVDGWIDGWHGWISDSPPPLPPPPLARWYLVSCHSRFLWLCVGDSVV